MLRRDHRGAPKADVIRDKEKVKVQDLEILDNFSGPVTETPQDFFNEIWIHDQRGAEMFNSHRQIGVAQASANRCHDSQIILVTPDKILCGTVQGRIIRIWQLLQKP